jgi:hypothetical protein
MLEAFDVGITFAYTPSRRMARSTFLVVQPYLYYTAANRLLAWLILLIQDIVLCASA